MSKFWHNVTAPIWILIQSQNHEAVTARILTYHLIISTFTDVVVIVCVLLVFLAQTGFHTKPLFEKEARMVSWQTMGTTVFLSCEKERNIHSSWSGCYLTMIWSPHIRMDCVFPVSKTYRQQVKPLSWCVDGSESESENAPFFLSQFSHVMWTQHMYVAVSALEWHHLVWFTSFLCGFWIYELYICGFDKGLLSMVFSLLMSFHVRWGGKRHLQKGL